MMSKRISILICALVLISLAGYAEVKSRIVGPTLSSEKAEISLGKVKFDENTFKTGSESDRTRMAADLLRNKSKYIGLPITEIKKRLGRPTGYFWNDSFPTYILSVDSPDNLAWQIVFLPDSAGKVKDIMINQNNYAP